MKETASVRDFYGSHPEMVSSPFGGVDSYNLNLFEDLFQRLCPNRPLARDTCPPLRVLEVGCGRAWLRRWFEAKGWEYIGTDLVLTGQPESSRAPDALADGHHLPFADGCFDCLVCIDAFEHFPDRVRAIREFRRVLNPQTGQVFLSLPNYGNTAGLVKWWCERWGDYAADTWAPFGRWTPQAHESFVTRGVIKREFSRNGFANPSSLGFAPEVYLGVFPWAAHAACPERVLFFLQRNCTGLWRLLNRFCPTCSLHQFWSWKVQPKKW